MRVASRFTRRHTRVIVLRPLICTCVTTISRLRTTSKLRNSLCCLHRSSLINKPPSRFTSSTTCSSNSTRLISATSNRDRRQMTSWTCLWLHMFIIATILCRMEVERPTMFTHHTILLHSCRRGISSYLNTISILRCPCLSINNMAMAINITATMTRPIRRYTISTRQLNNSKQKLFFIRMTIIERRCSLTSSTQFYRLQLILCRASPRCLCQASNRQRIQFVPSLHQSMLNQIMAWNRVALTVSIIVSLRS